jgi:hypothetical protein
MTKKLKKNIKQFVINNINEIEGYEEYEFKIIKTHPKFNQEKWDTCMNGDSNEYEITAQKMIKWAHKQIIKELFQ